MIEIMPALWECHALPSEGQTVDPTVLSRSVKPSPRKFETGKAEMWKKNLIVTPSLQRSGAFVVVEFNEFYVKNLMLHYLSRFFF